MAITPIPGAKRTDPWIPVGHPNYVFRTGADVQSTWRRYGWTPPSEKRTQFYEEPARQAVVYRVR